MANRAAFYQLLGEIAALPPNERHERMVALHAEVTEGYCSAVARLSEQDAARVGPDGRTVAQVIGHILEWDRFTLLGVGELLAGVEFPRIVNNVGWLDRAGQEYTFESVDEFNAFQAQQALTMEWTDIRDGTIRAARRLQAVFAHPNLVNAELLDRTRPFTFTLGEDLTLTLPVGWYMWMLVVEHQAIEHVDEVGWGWGDA